MGKFLTQEEFVKRSREKHGDKYDYSKVVYQGKDKKVLIICPIHGEFLQEANSHMRGIGCPVCSREGRKKPRLNTRKTTEQFIEDARKVHGNKYDYFKTEYVDWATKVCITCPEHGDFYIRPSHHTEGQGCSYCTSRHTHLSEFLERAREKHGDKYDYSKVLFKNISQDVCIICPEHGEFYQRASSHLAGEGCPVCAHKLRQQTCIKRYGVSLCFLTPENIAKARAAMIEKYGVDTVFKLESVQGRIRQTCLAKYGVEYPSQSPEVRAKVVATNLKRYGCKSSLQNADVRERQKATMMARYGVEYSTQSPSVKSKVKQTCLQRYGVENPRQSCEIDDKIKQTSQERYGVDYVVQSSVVKAKANATKRLRGTFNTSKPADMVGQMLRSIFGVDDVMCEYDGDKRYPFHCDFYIKSRDLFIEMNLFVSHGGHFFNLDSFEDLKKVSVWREKALKSKFYENMMHVWTVSDVLKRETARKFGLNYLTFWKFDLSDFYEWLDAGCPDGQDWKQEYSWKF